jgi:hypothetical protein
MKADQAGQPADPPKRVPAAKDRPQPVVVMMRDVKSRPVKWFWNPWIPCQAITILEGDPGVSKSTLTIDLAARASRGWRMPPEGGPEEGQEPAGVLILSAEDTAEDTIKPRLYAAEADMNRVGVLCAIRGADGADEMPPVIPFHVPEIETAMKAVGASLIIVDPLMSYLDGDVNTHNDHDVRRALHQMKLLAERTGAAVLIVRHLNKMTGGPAMYRGGGSIGIIGAARSAMLAGNDPTDPQYRVLAPIKNNLAPLPPSLRYKVEQTTVPMDVGGTTSISRIGWIGECDVTAQDLSAKPQSGQTESRADQCAAVVRQVLANGRVVLVDVLNQQLRAAGFADNAIEKGKKTAGVKTNKAGFGSAGHYARIPPPTGGPIPD